MSLMILMKRRKVAEYRHAALAHLSHGTRVERRAVIRMRHSVIRHQDAVTGLGPPTRKNTHADMIQHDTSHSQSCPSILL